MSIKKENNNVAYIGPMCFAHRGLTQKAPENMEGAFQSTVDVGCKGIKLEIHLSKDSGAVVCHESHFSFLTLGDQSQYSICYLADIQEEALNQIKLPYAINMLSENLHPFTENESHATVLSTVLRD